MKNAESTLADRYVLHRPQFSLQQAGRKATDETRLNTMDEGETGI